MRRLAISVLCLSLSLPVFAGKQQEEETTPKLSKGAIIEEDLKIENKMNVYKIYGSLKDIDKNKSDKMRLQGKVYVSPCKDKSLKGYNIANIQWLGVQKTDSLDKVVGFKEPIVSSFMFKDGVDIKNVPLPTFGDEQDLVRAITDLEQDKIDLEDLKRKRKFKTVYGKPDENAEWIVNSRRAKKANFGKNIKAATTIEPGASSEMGLDENGLPNDSNNSRKSSNDNQSGNSGSHLNSSTGGYDANNLPGFQSGGGTVYGKEKNKAPDAISNISSNDNPKEKTIYKHSPGYNLYRLDKIDEDNPPAIEGDAVVVAKDKHGKQRVYFVRDRNFIRSRDGRLASKEVDINIDGLTIDASGKVIKNETNREYVDKIINDLMFDFNGNLESDKEDVIDFGPEVRIELTEEGCSPEHDVLQERVIITARAKKIEDGKVVDEGVCEKTLESYPVKRDYLCDDCVYEVDMGKKKAYARYQEHWFDKNGERHNLGIKVDESHPFEIFEESRGCPFDIETDEGYAIKTSKLGYLNKFGIFMPVVGCGISDKSEKFKITETADGCSQLKVNGERHVQTKLIIKKGNKITEVRECRPSNIALLQDRAPCAGQYVHDFENGKSYPLCQYYYENEGQKHYVSECQKTAEYLEHQTEIKEWSHDDKSLVSKPILSVYIDDEDNKVAIKEKTGESVAYEQLADQTKPTSNFHYQGCYKITRTQLFNAYRRGDGSTYEKLVGEGNPITSANLCAKEIEYQTIDGINYYRNATRYPDGHSEYDAWVQY